MKPDEEENEEDGLGLNPLLVSSDEEMYVLPDETKDGHRDNICVFEAMTCHVYVYIVLSKR
jgi:hypothetical protein